MSYTIRGVQEIESSQNDPSVRGHEDPRHQNRRIPVVPPPVEVSIRQRGAWPDRRPKLDGYGASFGAASNLGAPYDVTKATRAIDALGAAAIAAVPGLPAAIDRIPPTPTYPSFKSDFKTRPVSAFLNLLTPLENLARDTVNNAVSIGGLTTLNLMPPGVPPKNIKMGLALPPQITDVTVKEGLVRLLVVQNWMILGYMRPQLLAAGFVKALVDESRRGIQNAAKVSAIATSLLRQATAGGIAFSGFGAVTFPANPGRTFLTEAAKGIKAAFPQLPFLQDIARAAAAAAAEAQRVTQQAANDTLMAKPVVDAFVGYVAKMGPLYAGLVQLVWDQKVLNDVWGAGDNIKARADSAYGKISTPAVKEVLNRIKAGVDKIKNSGTALDNTRKNLSGQPAAKQRVWAEAAVRFPQDAVSAISLHGLAGFGGLTGVRGSDPSYNFGSFRGLGAVGADDAAVAAAGTEAGGVAVTAGTTAEVAAPAAAPPVATGIGAAVTAAAEAAVAASVTAATAAATDKAVDVATNKVDAATNVDLTQGGGIPGLPGQHSGGGQSSSQPGGGGGYVPPRSPSGSGGGGLAVLAVLALGGLALSKKKGR